MLTNICGAPVTGDNLYGRESELNRLWERLEAGQNVLMVAPRRVGKTSLMQELRRNPRPGWIVFYSDLEKGEAAADCVAQMAAHLASDPATRTLLEGIDWFKPVTDYVGDFTKRVRGFKFSGVGLDMAEARQEKWLSDGQKLQRRLHAFEGKKKILFIMDELPFLLLQILDREGNAKGTGVFLGWLRSMRQDPKLRSRVQFIFGGSISLETLLRQHGLSFQINDLNSFSVGPWDEETAKGFLATLGDVSKFQLSNVQINQIIDLLGEAVPYHVQLFFQELRDHCQGDTGRLTAEVVGQIFHRRLASVNGGPHFDHFLQKLDLLFAEANRALAAAILREASKAREGTPIEGLTTLGPEDKVHGVVGELTHNGYLEASEGRILFRSNLVREYWVQRRPFA